MLYKKKRNCPDCRQPMCLIGLREKSPDTFMQKMEYAAPFSDDCPAPEGQIRGDVSVEMCGKCGRIMLFGSENLLVTP